MINVPSHASALRQSSEGIAAIKGSSDSIRMMFLTASLIGVQFTWGIEMTYCTPYLLKLGLSKSNVSLVWIAGPLSGLIMQPVVGIVADRSKSKWGRRRPFMVGGTIIVSLGLLLLGWTTEFVGLFLADNSTQREGTLLVAVLSIYAVDFAINVVQASARSLIVDSLPSSKQQEGSAWASRMIAVGHLIGCSTGAMDLTATFGTRLGDSQFKQVVMISIAGLILSVGSTCWAVSERGLGCNSEEVQGSSPTLASTFSELLKTTMNLPSRISAICWIQFWSWIGWFPFLFYSTTWIGEVYLEYSAPAGSRNHPDSLGQVGRIGSLSLVVFSLVTLVGSLILPLLIDSPHQRLPEFTPRPPASMASFIARVQKYRPSLLNAWFISHMIFAASMIYAPFIRSLKAATAIIAICGIPWTMQCWAPFTFMGEEINQLDSSLNSNGHKTRDSAELSLEKRNSLVYQAEDYNHQSKNGEVSGVYLGILNLFVTLPQFIATFISWAVFSILEPRESADLSNNSQDHQHRSDKPNAIGVCLFIGALAAVMAAYTTNQLKRLGRFNQPN